MYSINDYQIIDIENDLYIFHKTKAAKVSHQTLLAIIENLKTFKSYRISEQELSDVACFHNTSLESLKKVLINQLDLLRPLHKRDFKCIYLNVDNSLIGNLIADSLSKYAEVEVVNHDFKNYKKNSLILFYRNSYVSEEFRNIYSNLPENTYLVTSGIINKLLIIDNIYYHGSGLPTHESNLHQFYKYLDTELSATKDNWLLFYRNIVKKNGTNFPEPLIDACEQGLVAFYLTKFIQQFSSVWTNPLITTDELDWFWHIDLTHGYLTKEVAIHSAFSELDMNLNLNNIESSVEFE